MNTSSAISVMPRSLRQRSMSTGSGPASISTPMCGAAGSTSASPWPTSHATKSQPGGGQPDSTDRTGICTSTTSSTATAISRPMPPRATRATSASVAASSVSAPTRPPNQGRRAPGTLPSRSATPTSHRHGQPATQARPRAPPDQTGATTAAPNPKTVATGTAGSASTFAGTATRLTRPDSAAITGAVTRCAAVATAKASAIPAGTRRRRNAAAQPGASSSSAAVASTDMAKPASAAERRVPDQQTEHGRREHRHARPRPTGREADQRDRRHHGRPQHARRRTRDDDERDQDDAARPRRTPTDAPGRAAAPAAPHR